ncbi:SDR family oxidoreductase [Gordonia sp. PS3]|uniref:SDR family oxidoreductase n=1 Tax=Gordonia TaxID=2053 RepID=UPI001C92EE81|nr:SDR family oxidoreductase [Gordonia sihwensis]MBY4571665.1 short chain dehydrogenase [Gordonia sihwensis]
MSDTRPVSPLATAPEEVGGHGLLTGRKVIVTAAAGTGIGFSTARRVLLEGADVLVSDFHERRLGETVEKLSAEFPDQQVASFVCDVSSTEQVDALVADAAEQLGRIDVLVNNAGLGGETPVADMTDEQWDRVLDITLNSTFRATRAALRYFRDAAQNDAAQSRSPRGGVIVNNASVLGWRAQRGQAHYAAAKAGVMALTRCSAVEAADYGVRVNAVSPSIAKHPFLAKVTSDDLLDELAAREAYGRAAEVWEIASVIAMLASDYTTYMTGEIVSVSSQRA